MRCLFGMAIGVVIFIVAPARAYGQDCLKPPAAHAPERVTALQRQEFSAYRNDAIADQPFELHLIGSYGGSGRITVMPSDRPIVLAIGAYEEGLWHFDLRPRARLARIILFGGAPQRLKGAPADAEIIDRSGCRIFAYQWEVVQNGVRFMPGEFLTFLASAQFASGLVENSFQGTYSVAGQFTVPLDPSQYRVARAIERPASPRDVIALDPGAVLADYRRIAAAAPVAFRPTMAILIDLMQRGKLPVLFPKGDPGGDPNAPLGVRPLFEPLPGGNAANRCDGVYVLGRPEGETIQCSGGNQFYVLGDGDDVLKDSWGDDIVNPGRGDDLIDVGWGNDIVVLESGWGDDVINKTCHGATMSEADRARLNWQHRYNSFIVFGPGVRPEDIRWESKTVLTHAPSNSRLTLKGDCFNLVFTEDGGLKPFEPPAPPNAVAALPLPTDQAALQQRLREQLVERLATATQGDVILEVDRLTFESLDKQASLDARNGVARLIRRDGRLLLVFSAEAGRQGVIEIRPRMP